MINFSVFLASVKLYLVLGMQSCVTSEILHQHENGDIYVAEEYLRIKFSLFMQHIIVFPQVCLILLHLLNGWQSNAQTSCLR